MDFLQHHNFQGMHDIWEARKEQTLALAMALQCCTEQAGGPSIMMCSVDRDLQRCMALLVEFKEEDVLEIPPPETLVCWLHYIPNPFRGAFTPWRA